MYYSYLQYCRTTNTKSLYISTKLTLCHINKTRQGILPRNTQATPPSLQQVTPWISLKTYTEIRDLPNRGEWDKQASQKQYSSSNETKMQYHYLEII